MHTDGTPGNLTTTWKKRAEEDKREKDKHLLDAIIGLKCPESKYTTYSFAISD